MIGRKVIIIAHSAGGELANHLYSLLDYEKQSSVSLLFLGSAASPSDGSDRYIANADDVILQHLSDYFGLYIEPTVNMTIGRLNHEVLGYLGFEEIYLDFLAGAISDAIASNVSIPKIMVKLTWDTATDCDLLTL